MDELIIKSENYFYIKRIPKAIQRSIINSIIKSGKLEGILEFISSGNSDIYLPLSKIEKEIPKLPISYSARIQELVTYVKDTKVYVSGEELSDLFKDAEIRKYTPDVKIEKREKIPKFRHISR
ncbi:hypothetical protein J4440_03900 [Candidatus Woesearchaeota archaeon]|nr:hypothetical protein [Candidatus Woesearchaeota archaeon]